MPDATRVLEEAHRTVEGLFEQYQSDKDPAVVQQICTELTVHTAIEEEVVYPVLGDEVPDGAELRHHSEDEHRELKGAIARIVELGYDDPGVDELVQTIIQGLTDHVQEEEDEVFPKLRDSLDEDRLNELGDQLAAAEERQRRVARGSV